MLAPAGYTIPPMLSHNLRSFAPLLCLASLTLSGCGAQNAPVRQQEIRPAKVEFRLADVTPFEGSEPQPVTFHEEKLYLGKDVVIANSDIADAMAVRYPTVGEVISLRFKEDAAARLLEVTRQNMGKRMAVLLDNRILIAPAIATPFGDSAILEKDPDPKGTANRIRAAIGQPPIP
jgi:preprotein translocase subunit SecD